MIRKHLFLLMILALLAALCAQSALADSKFPIKVGDKGEQTGVIQTRLNELGYLGVTPKSPYLFDAKTQAAVKKFQAASGLAANEASATGTVDLVLYEMLQQPGAIDYEGYKDQLHVEGQSGKEILVTRKRLKALGYLSGNQSEKYDYAAVVAVACFQRANGLGDTGEADQSTRDALFSGDAVTLKAYQTATSLTDLKKGDVGVQVRVLQLQLSYLGFYNDDITGIYDAATIDAVKMFQDANSLNATGTADTLTRDLLNCGDGKDFDFYTDLQKVAKVSKGSTGYAVELLQERLTELYYFTGKIDGKYDAEVIAIVKRFQKANGLAATGVATTAVRERMNSAAAVDRVAYVGLKKGDEIEPVLYMTENLVKLGYLTSASEVYDEAVVNAVKLFQKGNGIKVTGVATPDTLLAINDTGAIPYDDIKNSQNSKKVEKMIDFATSSALLGKPYKNNCSVPASFDCSRYTKYVFAKMGVSLSGEVATQGKSAAKKYGKITSMGDLKRGDLLYFDTQPGVKPIGHSAIYLGKNAKGVPQFVHASSAAKKVVVSTFSDWYQERFLFGVRVWK